MAKENSDQMCDSEDAPVETPEVDVADDAASEDVGRIADLEGQLEQTLHERKDFEEKFIRVVAELQNYRKQSSNEVERARKFAIDRFAKEILGVLESLENAGIENQDVEDYEVALNQLTEGVELTRKSLVDVLEKFSVKQISVETGSKFDPEFHEAITMLPSDEVEPNHVLSVVRKGYTIHDRVLRAAIVIVAALKPVAKESSNDAESPEEVDQTS